jgi:GNAT superfamily N-acetyltransferase
MIFAALSEAADRGELLLISGGLCRFHLRLDGVVVIREILILPEARHRGLGRCLIEAVAARHPGAVIRAVCPPGYDANDFWPRLKFRLVTGAKANTWERPP